MNIKSLLLGSAAALAMVSGAHAADAIVAAEPEPLEYVRICDAYGAGYFYIPGTETCLKIGGMVRTEAYFHDPYVVGQGVKNGTEWHTRAELNVDTATDTEYGPLKTDMIYRFDSSEGTNQSKVLWATISLGGFIVGKTDSQYNQWIGYAGNVINDDVIGDGPYELNQLSYLYDSGTGLTGVISVEDSQSGAGAVDPNNGRDESDHYAPDAVAGIGYKAGAFGLKVVGGYDSVVQEGAIKARLDVDFGTFKAFLMGAWNTDGSKINRYANGELAGDINVSTGDYTVWGGTTVQINDKLDWNTQVAYADSHLFEATTNVDYFIAKGFKINPEITYVKFDGGGVDHGDKFSGVLRFQRTF
ncbi:porin [Rhizobium sp. VS19-DR104.2]|uniref:porin n=1 Tax=unclassified Rhizobium TaxID=2613769 RepID=UPI001C5AD3D6|nr:MULTISPECIES: porin [unclassified Rhizobium]MBZ5762112.1 porin [Rhizobium sp. VS19-DR96]MBZ5768225.1 porin [Rhizobium sp. VS19-DR129.2]MBZ5775710.1 porin [Rhizobium sp. VS19-DRK62.2]MBZ5786989.1 porin [Rhizobium sp. VS19-DR121]MBZ5804150.1 porin [Rhizobium sp. VS19-DR181]